MVTSKLVYGRSVASYKQKCDKQLQKGEALGKKNFKKFFSQKGLYRCFSFDQKWILHTLFDLKPLAVVECSDFYPGG